ncbi:nucleotidyltransferase domain-containing protein [Conexibacter stalactiti]|uniref:Nucleotidyltransferase domain-containing protein n=1 Tax=Conexibacter stalactiti TaxID=1940611 RepID=A0ABU4HX46_9ACTN|nr:nucleotidyltransferase domain-containing protein [Conexibacter stalactiti]MDW5597866.1 nucleotidyltransferase domain-containing protein [Conexibacter stalactiti]MEC5038508.1 nucleotidyltransferase domain-containing protein [Conexibacter stalactiti]
MLAVLAGTQRPLTGREVARLARRGSQRGVLVVLERLVVHGLVDRQEAGRALLFTLNREHVAAPAVETLADLRRELLARIGAVVAGWVLAPLHVSVFGSFARHEGDQRSDLDLLVVRRAAVAADEASWREQLDALADQVLRWSGNVASITEISEGDAGSLRQERPPIVEELLNDAIVLYGEPIQRLLRAED